jgi:[ribosomal protein S5]-alanine N-acetyltransferase
MNVNTDIFNEFPVLRTDRLTLREIRVADAQNILTMRSSGRVNQFIARPNMTTLKAAVKLVENTNLAYQNRKAIAWAGTLRAHNGIIGTCGFNQIDFPNLRAEIGGELSIDYWGKNIAHEAVTTIVKFGLSVMNLHSIEAKITPENRAAIALMEKIGFKKEAHFFDRIFYNDKFSDLAVYTLTKGNENYKL